jgi:hypothetical protein
MVVSLTPCECGPVMLTASGYAGEDDAVAAASGDPLAAWL